MGKGGMLLEGEDNKASRAKFTTHKDGVGSSS